MTMVAVVFMMVLSLQVIYPLKELQLIGSMRLPRDVNRTKLEVGTGCNLWVWC